MKKDYFKRCVVIFFFFLSSFAFSDDFKLTNVPDEFIGTYVPVQYDNVLKSSRSHYEAMLSNRKQYHDILLLNKDICYSNVGFHDGYAIKKEEFEDYRFVTNTKGLFIIDNNGNSYRKISNSIGNDGYVAFYSYVLKVIFQDAQALDYITLDKSNVIIDNVKYAVILDPFFLETKNISLWLRGPENLCALVSDGIGARLYEAKKEGHTSVVSKNCIKEFPLFYWKEADYPNFNAWRIPQESLKYIRNLIYAKHGYIFKSEELRSLYEGFSWYKRNPSFSENEFSKGERYLLKDILEKESR
ncbi:MAG: hypothetical protein BKP49_11075 [Treponema sp. CETP13]|nr:MAG: hypothetical protein BKP49_11075 [Treponema sp. CETP13]